MSSVIPLSPFGLRPVVVVAGGPSLTLSQVRTVGMARSQDKCRVIAVNDAVYPCWFADIVYAGDSRWWDRHAGLSHYPGLKIAIQRTKFGDVRSLENTGIAGYDPEEGCIRSGSNSGYQAVHLAAKMRARRILLLGFDYSGDKRKGTGTRDHWFGRHAGNMDVNSDTVNLRQLFRGLTDEIVDLGIEIINCSPKSTIQWLPSSTIEYEFRNV